MKKKSRKFPMILLIILGIILIAFSIFTALLPGMIFNSIVKLHVDFEEIAAEDYGILSEKITFQTEDGLNIVSWLVEAESPEALVVIVSGIHNPPVRSFYGLAHNLLENGYSTLLVEMRSHGESDGDLISLGFYEWLDIKAGVQYMEQKEGYSTIPFVVYGTSMGGATAINAIAQINRLDAVISVSGYSSFDDVFIDTMEKEGVPKVLSPLFRASIRLYLRRTYGDEYMDITPINSIESLNGRPALLFHSTEDSQIPFKSFERLRKAAREPEMDNIQTFTRDGNFHFGFLDIPDILENPELDTEYMKKVLDFLEFAKLQMEARNETE